MIEQYLDIHPEVAEAIKNNQPVVALESTIISHGMPYPQNVETARQVEAIIRERGAVPATICIVDGRIKVGLSEEELEFLGTAKDVAKVSRRDLPFIVAKKLNGATTVATTMIIAEMAAIEVFVTGGIGGVHRGAESNFDISADLTELSQTNVAVVCAGVKSILDLGLTLEYLETLGVPIIGYQTDELPAFYTRQSGFDLLHRSDSAKELAAIVNTKFALKLKGGVVIANPIPEAYAMDYHIITEAIETALKEADKQNVKGKDITPFLLSYIKEITKGKSLASNIQLVYNNARLGADLAVEMKK